MRRSSVEKTLTTPLASRDESRENDLVKSECQVARGDDLVHGAVGPFAEFLDELEDLLRSWRRAFSHTNERPVQTYPDVHLALRVTLSCNMLA